MSDMNHVSPSPAEDPDTINLLDCLEVILKRTKLILYTTGIAAVLSAIVALLLPNIYTAKTMIFPSQDDKNMASAMMSQMGGLASLAGVSLGGSTTTDLYVTLLKTETIRDPIIDRFELMKVYKADYRSDLYKILDSTVRVDAGKKDNIITLSVEDKDPKRASAMANAYVEELEKVAVILNGTGAGKSRTFLEQRLAKTKIDLAKAEDSMKEFQSKHKALNITEQAKATITGVAAMKGQLVAQEVQLAGLQQTYTDSAIEVKTMKEAIADIKRQIASMEGTGSTSSIPSIGSMPALGQEYLRLMREFKTQETLLELLTKQYEMAKFSEAKDYAPFQVLQSARVPEKKSKPMRTLIVLLTMVTAFFGSVFLVFVLEYAEKMPQEDRQRLAGMKAVVREQLRF